MVNSALLMWRIGNKTNMLEVVKLRFHAPITAEKWILSSVGDKWRNWKHCLKKKYWKDAPMVQLIEQQKDKRVKLEQWVKLLTYWSSKEAKKASKRNKKARAKKTMMQITGKRSFAKIQDKLLEMQERNNQLAEGVVYPIGPNDVFAQIMGPDWPGHVRMMGKGVCRSDVWGELPRNTSNHILKEQQSRITQLETMLLAQQRCGDPQVPSKQHGLSFNSLSNCATTNLPLMVGAYVTLKSLFDPNKVVAKGCINSIDPCSEVGGQLLGSKWCEVNVKVVFEHEEELIRPYGNLKKFAHVLGEMIAWPCNLVTPSEG
ncbi:hypothetical protein ACS0TY_013501 [Phlomoides rotata]